MVRPALTVTLLPVIACVAPLPSRAPDEDPGADVLASDVGWAAVNVVVDSTSAYWANPGTGSVMKVPLRGGAPVALVPRQPGPRWVGVDSQSVYWSNDGGHLMKAGIDGRAPPTTLASGPAEIEQFVVARDGVYWTTSAGAVMKVSLEGGPPVLLATQKRAFAIAVDSQNVYWTMPYDGGVMRVRTSGGEPVALSWSQDKPWSIAVDATTLYWVNYDTASLMKLDLAGGEPQPLLVDRGYPRSLAVDVAGLYWTNSAGQVSSWQPATGTRLLAAAGSGPAIGIALDATSVYWIGAGAEAILRAAK
jgi:sugar lactone lactonase YvrE